MSLASSPGPLILSMLHTEKPVEKPGCNIENMGGGSI